MASLIRALPSGEMFWFAGKSAAVLALAPVPIPIMSSYRNIQDISGTFNVTDTVTGKVTLTAINPNAAATLENYYKRMAAVSRLLEDQNAGLKLLAEGLTVDTNQTQISLSVDFKGDALAKIWNWGYSSFDISEIRNRAVGISKPSVIGKGGNWPVALFNPLPFYTESARKKRIEGTILVEVIILKDGTTGGFKVLRGLGYGLDESAVYTIANRWRFIPGVVDGKVVDTAVQIEVSFRLY